MSARLNGAYPTRNTAGLSGRGLPDGTASRAWQRNPSWLALTPPGTSDEKFVGLHAVWPSANFLALSAAGDYTVDWGDGSATQNFASGVVAYKEYDFADANLAGTNAEVTFQGTADTVTRTAHGYVNGDVVRFYNIVTTTGISENTPYYVINATANTFKVATTLGGAAVDLTNDGTGTLLPYKQVIVQVYPQAGQSLTQLNLHQKHNQTGLQAYASGFLDIAVAGANLTDLRIGAASPSSTTQSINFNLLERANIVRSDCRQLNLLFLRCRSLQSIVNIATSTAPANLNISVTFTDAGDLVSATAHGFRNGDSVVFSSITSTTGITTTTNYYVINAAADTFQVSTTYGGSAVALTTNGSGVAIRGTNMSLMFADCSALVSVPLFDTSAVTNMNSMFYGVTTAFVGCSSLQSVPLFNTSSVTNMGNMFTGCWALTSVPLFNTAAVTTMAGMFQSCFSLTSVPLLNAAAVTNMTSMFNGCSALVSVPLLNAAAVTNMTSMFNGCSALVSVPLLNTAAVTNMTSMFSGCRSLVSVPLFSTAAVTSMTSMFANCTALLSVPLFNTAAVTNMDSMFSGCVSLEYIPLFNTASVTAMRLMFNGCASLQTIPLLNTGAVTDIQNTFTGCASLSSIPALDVTGAFGLNTFSSCPSITRIEAKDFQFTFSVANCKLSSAALDEIYTNLPIAVGQTITVTGNYGTTGDNPVIATAKGWTVTG